MVNHGNDVCSCLSCLITVFHCLILSPKMCANGKICNCIPVEKGCLAIAIISAIGTGLVLLATILFGIMAAAGLVMMSNTPDDDPDSREFTHMFVGLAGLAVSVVVVIVGMAALIAFTFSVLLCNGICKRRPGQVKAYLVYGIVIATLTVIAAFAELFNGGIPAYGIGALIGTVIYIGFLGLVNETYHKLRQAPVVFANHIRLVEDY
ncbi:uncharacterized protein LOC125235463 isoform X2 [Leguminivora glycinivorella]|uniref:uncharacterized protein LOC125235463 isoform X2 n=1 Tax=Leguminivora glycinivorella TaxID=1035111 RepID=UPI00200EBC52|nr:uncharacterized protein LOC125235463 isoform X2 [Leguminivora glycinivorella]XP_047997992.1 uncharacterized protein LOC125235463 isoform X2 [Leguminivora glycinivorella]